MNTERCPCCGLPNRCAQIGNEQPVTECWCFTVEIAPQQLEQVPEHLRNRACLCPRCAQALPPQER